MIRIRGWHTKQKKMYSAEEMTEDQLAILPTGNFANISGLDKRFTENYPVSEFIPLLSTGVHDKDKEEIYQQDILRIHKYVYVVVWSDDQCSFVLEPVDKKNSPAYLNKDFASTCKRIGNTYENSELLNVK